MRLPEFYAYLKAREEIRIAKERKQEWPWTDDPILRQYKFTNVRREYDRTSMELAKAYRPHHDAAPEVILLNCAIGRYFGTYEFFNALGWQNDFNPERIKKLASDRLANKERVFTGAYVITNQGISKPKQEVVVDYFLKPLWAKARDLGAYANKDGSWERLAMLMKSLPGFGGTGFMIKEVTLDTMFFPKFWPVPTPNGGSQPIDYATWTPVGPGAARGIARVTGAVEKKPQRMLQAIRTIAGAQGSLWPSNWGFLSPTDIQFGLCEFDKYERVRLGEGKPRSSYKRPK